MLIFQLFDYFVPSFKCSFRLFIEVVGMTIKYFNELAEPQMLAIPVKAFPQQVQHSYVVLLAFLVKITHCPWLCLCFADRPGLLAVDKPIEHSHQNC